MGVSPSSEMWRPCPFGKYKPEELRAEIAQIMSQSASLMSGNNIRIVICGTGMDGKSSAINNILTALEGKYSESANVGGQSGGDHVTQKYIEHQMLVGDLGSAKNTGYVLCDAPGLNEKNKEVQTEAIKAVIEGKFIDGDTLAYDKLTLEDLGKMQARQARADCVIFIIAATKMHFTADAKNGTMVQSVALKSLKTILDFARQHNIKTACLMTKCDELDSDVGKDLRQMYYSATVETARQVIKENFLGFAENRIFPIVNYTNMLQTSPNMMVQTLFALKHIMHDIHSRLRRMVRRDGLC